MISFFLLAGLWTMIWLLHLNGLPDYRRQNPCRLPPDDRMQRHVRRVLPATGLAGACLLDGLDGLFLWAFTAPVTGIALGMALPFGRAVRETRAAGCAPATRTGRNRQNLQKHPEAPKYLP